MFDIKLKVFDYDILAREIITQIRGDLSQRALSSKLGFTFNQVGKWESGFTKIKWHEFIELCLCLQIPIENSIRVLLNNQNQNFDAKSSIRTLEAALGLSTNLNYDEHKQVQKWISGKTQPCFMSILKALDSRPAMLLGWLSYFIDCNKLQLIKKKYEDFLLRIDSVLIDPNCVFVNAALNLKSYKDLINHDEKLLAEHSSCSVEHLRTTLKLLLENHIITYNGKKYFACPFDFSFSALPLIKLRNLTKYTTELAAKKYPMLAAKRDLKLTPNISLSSVRVVAMSSAASQKVANLIAKFHNEMANIVYEDQGAKDNVQIVLMHSFGSNIS